MLIFLEMGIQLTMEEVNHYRDTLLNRNPIFTDIHSAGTKGKTGGNPEPRARSAMDPLSVDVKNSKGKIPQEGVLTTSNTKPMPIEMSVFKSLT